jgi:hypothetical protein
MTEEREMRQKPYVGPFVTMFVGLGLFGSLARSPSFQTYRTFDIVSLVLVGVCFGYAAASIACLRRQQNGPIPN